MSACNIKQGKVIEYDDLTWKRPAFGIPPNEFEKLVGMKAKTEIEEDTVLQWEMFEN